MGHGHRYAVEQMTLMLLGKREQEDEWGRVTLSPDGRSASAVYSLESKEYQGFAAASDLGPDTPGDQKALEQRLVKLAVFQAVTQFTGTPPWGALSGVRPAKLAAKWLRQGITPHDAQSLLENVYHLSPQKARLTLTCAQASLDVEQMLGDRDICLYIGVPFCPTRCAYCSFVSADVAGALALVEPYVSALLEEIAWAGEFVRRQSLRVRAVYMGGGTPTTLSAAQLDSVLTGLDSWLDRDALLEFTVEAGRPDTISLEKLAVLRRHGVDRVSVNPQTLSDTVLQAIGRRHTAQQFLDAYALAREAGFDAVNTDLIAGLPRDDLDGFRATLDGILALSPEEITLHTLALKHGSTLLETRQAIPDGDAVVQMLDEAQAAFTAAGYRPYYLYRQKYMTGGLENVGWTRRERGSVYNIVMMEELRSVLALGAGGVSKIIHPATGHIERCANPKYAREYLDRLSDTMKQRETFSWIKPIF